MKKKKPRTEAEEKAARGRRERELEGSVVGALLGSTIGAVAGAPGAAAGAFIGAAVGVAAGALLDANSADRAALEAETAKRARRKP
jgi:uncharacterized protein YcfJ